MQKSNDLKSQFGPLADLIGIWEGNKGDDLAIDDDRKVENNKYRERVTFEDGGLVDNHEQKLYVLRYSMRAWRLGEDKSFHEEVGYWSWEPATQQVLRSFVIPRGIVLIAGGQASKDAREFKLRSDYGSGTFGICNNPFLDREFKTLSYEVSIQIPDRNTFSYSQDSVIQIKDEKAPFHHTDRNTLKRIS